MFQVVLVSYIFHLPRSRAETPVFTRFSYRVNFNVYDCSSALQAAIARLRADTLRVYEQWRGQKNELFLGKQNESRNHRREHWAHLREFSTRKGFIRWLARSHVDPRD